MDPPNLRYIVQATIIKYLVCSSDISRQHIVMLEYLRNFGQGIFGDEILSQVFEDFPGELTDELLSVLSPPHLKQLKLRSCNRLSCSGLQTAIAKCHQLQAIDFTECIHLLHPVVFCCIKEKATKLVSLSFENSELVSDDIVQVALMCCPGLKHLNLSSCKNITDAAFAIRNSKKEAMITDPTHQMPHAGFGLTNVDISGCRSLSTDTVKHLVSLCGSSLTSINLAYTGVNCMALLYLAGLNIDKVARIMHNAVATDLALTSNQETVQEIPNHNQWCNDVSDSVKTQPSPMMSKDNDLSLNENLLNEMEVLTLKFVLPTCHVDEQNKAQDGQSHKEFGSDTSFAVFSSLSPEIPPSDKASEHENARFGDEECNDDNGERNFMERAGDRTICWNDIPTEDGSKATVDSESTSCNRMQLLSKQEEITSTCKLRSVGNRGLGLERYDLMTVGKQTTEHCGSEEILAHEDNFEVESHPVHDDTTPRCEEAGEEKSTPNYLSSPTTSVNCDITSTESALEDEDAEIKDFRIHARSGEGEKLVDVLPSISLLHLDDVDNDYSSAACKMSCAGCKSSTPSNIPKKNGIGKESKNCWEVKDVLIDGEEEVNPNQHTIYTGEKDNKSTPDCLLSPKGVIQISDLLVTQSFQPQIATLDITGMHYPSKQLGNACLKIFSHANEGLKNFTISWLELEDGMLRYILRHQPDLESLSLVDCEKLSNLSLISIPVHCPTLSSFELKGMCYVTDHGLVPLTRSKHLQSLSLAEAAITDFTLESIAKGCGEKLKVLDISWCEDVTDQGISAVANSCRSLQRLGLRQCAASKPTITALGKNCHNISCLNIAGIDSFTDDALSSLAKNMPLLREIDASWNSCLSDNGIKALMQSCVKLKKAVLNGLKLITSQPFLGIVGDLNCWSLLQELWRYNKKFQSVLPQGKVSLKPCDTETAKSLGDQMPCRSMSFAPSLRHIELEYSDKVNDDHLAAIVAICRGTLYVKDYYGQSVEPKWIFR